MAEAFDKGRGFTLAVKGRDGEDQTAFLAGERPGAVFVDVAIEPQAEGRRQRQNQRKKRDGSFFQPSSLPTQRNTAARCNPHRQYNGKRPAAQVLSYGAKSRYSGPS